MLSRPPLGGSQTYLARALPGSPVDDIVARQKFRMPVRVRHVAFVIARPEMPALHCVFPQTTLFLQEQMQ